MPAKSKAQQRFMALVKSAQSDKGVKLKGKAAKAAKEMKPKDVDDFASTKHKGLPDRVKKQTDKPPKEESKVRSLIRNMVREIMREGGPGSGPQGNGDDDNPFDREPSDDELADIEKDLEEGFEGAIRKSDRKAFDSMRRKQSEVLGYKLTGTNDMKVETDDATVKEAKKRDYKAEYKKYGSSDKAKKYRAELNAYNRKRGTYGNGDGKDASHKGGKIVGYEEQSKNRGRREKSRLKKEATVRLSPKKDVNFGSNFLQLLGKKGKIRLDKKSVKTLAKIVRSNARKYGMGFSFTAHEVKESKLTETKIVRLPNGVKVKIEFKGLTFKPTKGPDVFLDRNEMMKFFKATSKYMKEQRLRREGGPGSGRKPEGDVGGPAHPNVHKKKKKKSLGTSLADKIKKQTDKYNKARKKTPKGLRRIA